jgi:hypothetical protein
LLFGLLTQCHPTINKKDVAFINKAPIIDGQLDSDLEYVDTKKLNSTYGNLIIQLQIPLRLPIE